MGEVIPHWLTKQKEWHPDKIAIDLENGMELTFRQLYDQSRKIAAGMINCGIQRGDHIALLADNQLEVPLYIHAASYAGAVLVLLNTRLTSSELAFQLKDSDAGCLFYSRQMESKITHILKSASHVRHYDIESFSYGDPTNANLVKELDLDQVSTMMYTSGTTGTPKAVTHTYGNHWFSAMSSALNLGLQKDDKWLVCLPMFHVGGFSIVMKSVIYGMSIKLLEKFDEKKVHEAILNHHVTHVSLVTVMLRRLLEQFDQRQGSYPEHFRCMLLGGGPVPENLLHKSINFKIPVFQTYGMTETSSQIATLSPEAAFQKIGSAGKALAPASIVIAAEKCDVGEILVKGPMVSKGYYKHPSSKEEYFHTGDLGYQDSEGFLYIVDRVKDVIISGGENIYPAEVEGVLSGFPGVIEAGVTGREDRTWGEVPVAFLVVTDRQNFSVENMWKYCEEHLAKYKWPKDIYFLEELPRNASNKLLRRKLFATLEEN